MKAGGVRKGLKCRKFTVNYNGENVQSPSNKVDKTTHIIKIQHWICSTVTGICNASDLKLSLGNDMIGTGLGCHIS